MNIHRRRTVLSRAVHCEALERRTLLALSPAGAEFRVNTFTTNTQANAAIAADADGDFVVVWDGQGVGDLGGVFAQRYNAAGVAQGGEFRANTNTTGNQSEQEVAIDADGDFVVVWSSLGQDGSGHGIYGQRYNAVGVPQGGEFRVNTFTTGDQRFPSVAMDASGHFVVAWGSSGQDGSDYGIYAQRYNVSGVAQGGEFRVNTRITSMQHFPAVAMSPDGRFNIGWNSLFPTLGDPGGSGLEIYAQRYDAAGNPQGAEFHVNSFTTNNQAFSSVAMDSSGDFLITWSSSGQDGSGYGIYAQRYNSAGAAQGSEFRVNTLTTNSQSDPRVAMRASGNFVVTWASLEQDGSDLGIFAKSYNAAGTELARPAGTPAGAGNEFRANTFTTGLQFIPGVAMNAKGDVTIAWHGNGTGDADGAVYAQRYSESTDTAAPIVGGVFVNGARVTPYLSHAAPLQSIVVSFSENMTDAGGPTGVNSVTNPANWLLTRNGGDVAASISSIGYQFNLAANRFEATLNLGSPFTSGNFLVMVRDNVRDIAGNQLDGNLDGAATGNALVPFSLALFGSRGPEFRVNTFTTNRQASPQVATDADGDFVVAWTSYGQDGSSAGVFAQRYNVSGVAQGPEFQVNTFTTSLQIVGSVAMDDNGNFVVVWSSQLDVFARRYDAAGTPLSGEFRVNTFTTDGQTQPSLAMDADGDFVVTWVSNAQDGMFGGIYAQRYSAAGVAQGLEFRVNTFTTDGQNSPSVAMDANGDFVVAWDSQNQDGSYAGVYAQRYNAAGAAQGGEFRVNTFTTNAQLFPAVAMDADGNFVVAWSSAEQDASPGLGVYAQRYNALGTPQGAEFRVNTFTTDRQESPSVAMDADGDFVVTWRSRNQDGSVYGVFAQRYNVLGTPRGGEFRVNSFTTDNQEAPAVAMNKDGDFVVAWHSAGQDGSDVGVFAQRYALDLTPIVGSLLDTPDPVVAGNSLTLSATGALDDSAVVSVSFYRETNLLPGLQVGFQGDLFVGTDTTPSGGVWSVNAPTSALGNGAWIYWAQATDDAALIGTPASTTNTVTNAPAPAVNASSFLFATLPQRLRFTFNQDVSASLTLADIVVTTLPGGPVITPSGLAYDSATNTATVTLTGVLADANYRATLLAAGITSPGGTPMSANHVLNFHFLLGDADGDGRANLNDFNILAGNFGQSPRNFSQGDFNYDTIVNLLDFDILASRFGTVLGPQTFAQETIGNDVRDDDQRELLDELK